MVSDIGPQHSYWEKRAQEKITSKEEKITSAEVTEAQNNAAVLRNVEHISVSGNARNNRFTW